MKTLYRVAIELKKYINAPRYVFLVVLRIFCNRNNKSNKLVLKKVQ